MLASSARPDPPITLAEPNDSGVAVVITTYNDPAFLRAAISSVIAQQHPVDEIIVVDDGSKESPAPLLADFPQVILMIRTHNGGLSRARNDGLRKARSGYIAFLDADDRLEPNAIAAGLAGFAARPDAAMVYGGHRRIHADGSPLNGDNFQAVGENPYADLLTFNRIGMHAAVLYRRSVLLGLGGFDENLRMCEDYDVYLRLARSYPVTSHSQIIAEYRWHGSNMSKNSGKMLRAVLAVHDRHQNQPPELQKAWHAGRRNWKGYYRNEMRETMRRSIARRAKQWLRNGPFHRLTSRIFPIWPPPLGAINFGQLTTTRPISLDFGWDRGNPIDRYYVENFLAGRSGDIAGRVLEIGDDEYSRRYGNSKISRQDVLHFNAGHPKATLTGDLTHKDVLPEDAFDCIVLTQTLHLIFELEQAVQRLYGALKPGGVLLLTVPGISQIDRQDWRDTWCWSFTAASVRRLFEKKFTAGALEIQTHGNVFAATAFLQGVALEEVDRTKLDVNDPAYPVIVTLRAQKP